LVGCPVSLQSLAQCGVPAASSSKTPESLFASLNASGLPDTPDAHEFIAELFKRAPRKHKRSSADSVRKQAEKDAKALRSQKFNFLLDDAATEDVVPMKKEKRRLEEKGKERDKRDRHTRKREYDEKEWESDEEEKSRKRRRSDEASGSRDDEPEDIEMPEDEDSRQERERLADLRDRDAFAERVKDRDREKTKKIVEDRSSKNSGAAAEAAQRRQLAEDVEGRVQALPSLRLHSRQEYLTKRELQQIELLRKEIADDESLFRGMKIYQLPEDYITEQGKIDSKKKENALYKRYEEAKPKDDQFVTDIDQWEASQTHHSTFRTGAMDKQEIHDDYEYVFDESQTIKFALDVTLESPMTPAEKLLHAQIDAAEKKGAPLAFHVCFLS
jgi:pre-mRNA-splicing factor ATP-dependent RNA helicase DHX16